MMNTTTIAGPPPTAETYRFSTDEERERRMSALREAMAGAGFEALVVCGRDDIRYRGRTFWVSDVWQLVADTHVVVLPAADPVFVGGQVFGLEQPEQTDWAGELRINGNPGAEIADVLIKYDLGAARIGVVGMTDAALAAWHLAEMKAGAPEATFEDATDLFEEVRQLNSPEALAAFKATSEVMLEIYSELEPQIHPGMREIDLAALSHKVSREFGLRDPMVLLQTTPYGALSFGTTKEIGADDIVCLWIESAGPSGFWLEFRRCYSFGSPSDEMKRFWELQVECLKKGLGVMKPGVQAHEFATAVQEVLDEEGYELGWSDPSDPHHMFSLHGIGTDAIQGVWVPGKDRVLHETEVVNVHPTLEFNEEDLKKFGWLGTTDNVLITPDGGKLMTYQSDISDGFVEL
jgi:Xaa-Pro aminopeptidase